MKTVENYTNREWYYRAGYKVARIFTTGCMPVMEDTTESSEMMVVARNFPDSPNSVLIPLESFTSVVCVPRRYCRETSSPD